MTQQEQQAHANAIHLKIIKVRQAEIDKLSKSLNAQKDEYVKITRKIPNGAKVIVQPKYGAKFYGLIESAYFDEESEFDNVRYMVKPVKKGWAKPDGYNRRYSVGVTMKSEILHVEP